jgi:hypothetical protein
VSKDPCTLSFVIAVAGSSTRIFSLVSRCLRYQILASDHAITRSLPSASSVPLCFEGLPFQTRTYVALPFVASVSRQFIPNAINDSNVINAMIPQEITQ